jgi:capsular exopolysaccharide synthesis family protein
MAKPPLRISDCFGLESPLATEYRRLFQNLRRVATDSELKSILITSAVTGEGKSTIASLLALTAARKNNRTLLLDCDVRRPTIHRMFGLERLQGLVEIVQDGLAFKSAIKKTSLEHLDIITAGKVTPHPSELFNSQAVDALIRELKFYYDYLIIDSPPVIPVSDPMLLSQSTDGVLMAIKAGSTAREVVRRAVEIMQGNHANLLGVVLNNASNSLPYYYDYSHYHYDYSQADQSFQEPNSRNRQLGKNGSRDKQARSDQARLSSGEKRQAR